MKGVPRFQIQTSVTHVASDPGACGEDSPADRAPAMTSDDRKAIQRIAAVYWDDSYPLPVESQRTNLRQVASPAIAYFERSLRP
ncbi:MAG: hypothetical protein JWQ32_3439 [Marmoricola sp.]|nr:hypothetical protein [Marmoricola sp.]